MNYRKLTMVLIGVVFIGLSLYDLLPAVSHTRGDTISETIRDYAGRYWTIPWVLGVLMGHFFFNVEKGIARWRTIILMPVLTAGLIGADVLDWTPYVNPVFVFLPSFIGGRLLWPQREP